jgi:hypothetical protein
MSNDEKRKELINDTQSHIQSWRDGINRKTVEENWEELKKTEGIKVGEA